ncbi:MAG: hypothetical protein ABS55_12105 [Lautropia sp. SCN 70-15]|nr:MAG: hypothetical protein ABS55_12105 [Lautropia sp. SCN 70-15]
MRDLAFEAPPGIGIDGEARLLAHLDAADVGLVDAGVDLHVAQVAGDHEQFGRLQARGHRLAGIDRALDDHAVDRAAYHGAVEVDPRRGHRRLALPDHRLGVAPLGDRDLDCRAAGRQLLLLRAHQRSGFLGLGRRDEASLGQVALAREITPRLVEVDVDPGQVGAARLDLGLLDRHLGAGRHQVRLGLRQAMPEGLRVDAGEHLPCPDLVVEVRQHLAELAGDLRADRHAADRIDRARCADRGHDVAAADRRGAVLRRSVAVCLLPPPSGAAGEQQGGEPQAGDSRSFHGLRSRVEGAAYPNISLRRSPGRRSPRQATTWSGRISVKRRG